MSQTAGDLLIIFEPEARQWAMYLCSIFNGHIPRDGIRCYDIATVTTTQGDDFLDLGRYLCKLLILSRGMVEEGEGEGGKGLCQMKRFFLSRVLSPAASVVVLLCGVESLSPLLGMVALKEEQCLLVSTEQDAHEYLAAVIKASGELFVLVRDKVVSGDIEAMFRGGDQSVRVKATRWNEHVLLVQPPDFPSGTVEVTLCCGGQPVHTAQIQYYSRMGEISQLLTRVADPVEFMCEALQVSSLEKLDAKLASIVLKGIPSGGFQELLRDNTPEKGGQRHEDLPTLLHFAAQHGMRDLGGVLLQCPGAQRALHTANRQGMTPGAIASRHGHAELHVLLKEALNMHQPRSRADASVYELMSTAGSPATSLKEEDQREEDEDNEDDPYTLVGMNNEEYDSFSTAVPVAQRPPAPRPRPAITTTPSAATTSPLPMDGPKTYISQVFQKKKSKGNADMTYSLPAGQGHKDSLASSTYDAFVPGPSGGAVASVWPARLDELPPMVRRGSLTVDKALELIREWEGLHCRALAPLQQEKLDQLRASVLNSRQDDNDSIYDKFNVVHPTTPTNVCRRGSQQAKSDVYSKSRKGQHSNVFWKADKR